MSLCYHCKKTTTKPSEQDFWEKKKKDPHRASHQLHKDECEHQNQDNEQEIEK